eukprot:CAMPEP_0174250240 /NCGR_PEP_ID=MMETSP0439-20130205/471_1 /TAXON_ID=0 /ORGANISM="Stereomyxa ramosa, Strain Chinc5" /LENGTH=806 /DNA_ID=CAMNT_0015330259 /DNA_START=57 /DNA_END=2477 /DNA_ORIENTATION=+
MHMKVLCVVLLCVFVFVCDSADPCSDAKIDVSSFSLDDQLKQLLWADADHVFALTISGYVYSSSNSGKDWVATVGPSGSSRVKSMYQASDNTTIILLGYSNKLFVSEDSGGSFSTLTHPRLYQIKTHPTDRNYLMGLAATRACLTGDTPEEVCHRDVYISTNLGGQWTKTVEYVNAADWFVDPDGGHPESILVITWAQISNTTSQKDLDSYNAVLVGSDNLGKDWEFSWGHIIAFIYYNDIILAAEIADKETRDLRLVTSRDRGQNKAEAKFPKDDDFTEMRYTILDLTEGSVFVNVDHSPTGNWGHTYSSNAFDQDFSLSLPYTKRDPQGRVDFAKVRSLQGVYVANEVEVESADSTKSWTVMTFDKGGLWSKVEAPDDEFKCTGCSLNLLGKVESSVETIYSTPNAIGLILASGSVGMWVLDEVDELNTYMSRNGGVTWKEIAKGDHLFEFGDHGAVTLIAKSFEQTTDLLYSYNDGIDVSTCQFTDEAVNVLDIVIEPENTARTFLVHTEKDGLSMLFHVDFSTTDQVACTADDYEYWSPVDELDGKCILGVKMTYKRRKEGRTCYNTKEHGSETITNHCACKREDFECDECFEPDYTTDPPTCVQGSGCSDPFAEPSPCYTVYNKTQGYRLVPGDQCDPLLSGSEYQTYAPIATPCGAGGDDGDSGSSNIGVVLGVLALIVVVIGGIIGLAIGLLYVAKRNPEFAATLENYLPSSLLAPPSSKRGGGSGYSKLSQASSESLLDDLGDDNDDGLLGDEFTEPDVLDDHTISSMTTEIGPLTTSYEDSGDVPNLSPPPGNDELL